MNRFRSRSVLAAAARTFSWPLAIAAAFIPGLAGANPGGGVVTAGQATISAPAANLLQIDQHSSSAVIDWQQFSIARGEQVSFNQPSVSAAVLNRVTGGSPSEIFGRISSNGRVFLINPQGILFGSSARVDVGSLMATTLNVSDADFMNGRMVFAQPGAGSISNAGRIVSGEQGFVVLAGDAVSNSGNISAPLGDVLLASGSALTLTLDPAGLIGYRIDAAALSQHAGVTNLGAIKARGGSVTLTARSLIGAAVNNSGRISAQSVEEHLGEIFLSARGGEVVNRGVLDARDGRTLVLSDRMARLESGSQILAGNGVVEVSAPHLLLRGETRLGRHGKMVIDPAAFVIRNGAQDDGCVLSGDDICEADLESTLAGGGSLDIIASDSITFEDFEDGALNAQAANNAGTGGSLFLGIGFGSDAASFQLGDGGSIHGGNALLLDGNFTAIASDDLLLGDISSRGTVSLTADRGVLHIGNLAAANADLFARVSVITGNITLNNSHGAAALYISSEGFVDEATEPDAVHVMGNVNVTGTIASFKESDQKPDPAVAASATFSTPIGGGVRIDGAVNIDGTVSRATFSGTSGSSVTAAELDIRTEADFVTRNIRFGGPVSVTGHIGQVSGGGNYAVTATRVSLFNGFGSIQALGDFSATGTVDSVTGGNFIDVTGVDVEADTHFGNISFGQALTLNGSIGSAHGARGLTVAGSSLKLSPDADLTITGALHVTGSVDNFIGGDDGGVVGANVFTVPFFGNSRFKDTVNIDGSVNSVRAGGNEISGDNLFVFGANATFLGQGDSESNSGGDVEFSRAVHVTGGVGEIHAGNFSEVTGAGLWADSTLGHVRFGGLVAVSGSLGEVLVGNTSSLTGSFVYMDSFNSYTRVDGPMIVNGFIHGAGGGGNISATGSSIFARGAFGDARRDNAPSLDLRGNVIQSGSIGRFDATDEGSSAFAGSATLDSGDGGIAFKDVTADNLFLYYNSDSVIGRSRLTAADYLEIFTTNFGPTLSGNSLDIRARDAFIGGNLTFNDLSIGTEQSLTVFLAQLDGTRVNLASGGNVALVGEAFEEQFDTRVSGQHVSISGRSIFGDASTTIDGNALDLVATDTILLEGATVAGDGSAANAGDPALLQRLGRVAPGLLPDSAAPNAFISADTIGIADLSLAGDHLHIRSNFLALGQVQFEQPGTLVQLEPLASLPFFAESVNVQAAGLEGTRVRSSRGSVVPSVGSFSTVRGQGDLLGAGRPDTSGDDIRAPGTLAFDVGPDPLSFGELIQQSGLSGSTLVIGGSNFGSAIQISDQLSVDVRPSLTNFVFLTRSGILGFDRVLTNGKVVLLGGTLFTLRSEFYALTREQINSFYAGLDNGITLQDRGHAEEGKDELACK